MMALSKLAVRRLTKLADYMDSLPREAAKHFAMDSWLVHHGDDDHGFCDFIKPQDPMTCGTTACALGWAATVPSFRKQGLKVMVGDGWSWDATTHNLQTAQEFFDCDELSAIDLFGGHDDLKTPKQWAKKCRKFLKEKA